MGSTIAYYEKLILKPNKRANQLSQYFFRPIVSLCVLLCFLLFLFAPTRSYAYETSHDTSNAKFSITLSQEVRDALENGIVLTFDCDLQTNKKIWFLSLPKNKEKYSFTLSRHSLSNRYLVIFKGAPAPKNFSSANEATAFISEQSFKFLQRYTSNKNDSTMRLSLNKFKLLGPMRLNAFLAKQWDIDTGWISWSPEI